MKIENLCMKCMREKLSPDAVCEYCGFDLSKESVPPHHLDPFSILEGKYLTGMAIGEGGFGITYIGMDLNLEMRVAIKEYYPNGCAIRDMSGNRSRVQPYMGEQQKVFEDGREKFINEARVLARCVNLSEIVTVKDFFKENNTAYIVMEYIDGKTLKAYLKEQGGKISVQETLRMMKPVIQSLGEVHKMHLIHRDISPDNMIIRKDGFLKLLDFGGARNFVTSGKSMSIMLKPGYAPEEQYRIHGEQGAWTDIYAICATMYRCITGEIPPDAMERSYQDRIKPFSAFQVSCPSNVECAIFKGLSVYKNERFQSMEELYGALYDKQTERDYVDQEICLTDKTSQISAEKSVKTNKFQKNSLKIAIFALGCVSLLLMGVISVLSVTGNDKDAEAVETVYNQEEHDMEKQDMIKIGFSQADTECDWRNANSESMKSTFSEENGYELIFDDAQQKQENQLMAIRNFIQQEVDYIVFAPVTGTGWDTVLQEAKDADIPVIIVERMIDVPDDGLYTAWVGSDFELEGKKACAWLISYTEANGIGEINIVDIQGTIGTPRQIGRTKGLEDAAAEYGWNILAMQTGEFTQAKGQEVMESMLKQYDNINVVYCENDNEAFGAIDAIEAAGKTVGSDGDILVMSFDATKAGITNTLDGKIICNTECNPSYGSYVEEIIKKLEAGENVEKQLYVEEGIYVYGSDVAKIQIDGEIFEVTEVTQEVIDARVY